MNQARFEPATLDPIADRRVRELWGRPPINLYRILAHHTPLLRAWTEWNNDLRHGCELPRALREMIFLRSAVLHASDYEWTQHVVMARKAGLAAEKIAALRGSIASDRFDEREMAVLEATDEIASGALTDPAFRALRDVFSAAETIEVIVTASHTCMLVRIIQAVGVSADGEADAQSARERET